MGWWGGIYRVCILYVEIRIDGRYIGILSESEQELHSCVGICWQITASEEAGKDLHIVYINYLRGDRCIG